MGCRWQSSGASNCCQLPLWFTRQTAKATVSAVLQSCLLVGLMMVVDSQPRKSIFGHCGCSRYGLTDTGVVCSRGSTGRVKVLALLRRLTTEHTHRSPCQCSTPFSVNLSSGTLWPGQTEIVETTFAPLMAHKDFQWSVALVCYPHQPSSATDDSKCDVINQRCDK